MLGHHAHSLRFAACKSSVIEAFKQTSMQGKETGDKLKTVVYFSNNKSMNSYSIKSSNTNLSSASFSLNVGRVAVLENRRL